MKYIIPILIALMLLPSASAKIVVSTNATRPVFHISLAQDDGTNQLAADTNYYFQCFLGGYGYEGMSVSPASEEFNITTNSTHRWINISNLQNMCNSYNISANIKGVHCRWSANRSFKDWGGEGYMPASFSNNESTYYQYWTESLGNPGVYFAPYLRCSSKKDSQILDSSMMIEDSGRSGRYIFHPEISIPLSDREKLNATMNIYKGTADVKIDTTSSNTWDDLVNAFIDSGNGDLAVITNEGITFMGQIYGSGELSLSGKNLYLIGGDNDDPNLEFTDKSTITMRPIHFHWHNIRGKFYDSSLNIYGGATILNNIDAVSNLYFTLMSGTMTHYSSSDGWIFNAKIPNTQHQTRYSRNFTVTNNVWNRVYEALVYKFDDNAYSVTTYENCTLNDITNNYDFMMDLSYDYANCNVTEGAILINTVTNRPDKKVRVYFSRDASPGVACGSRYFVDAYFDSIIKVIDENGNPISGANVSFTGETTNSTLTDSNGIASIRLKAYGYTFNNSVYLRAELHDYGNYTMTITKSGYRTYNTSVYVDSKKDWTIALESKPAWNTTKPVSLKIWNSTGYVIMKLTDDGDMAIAGTLHENTDDAPADYVWGIPGLLWLDSQGNLYILGLRVY